MKKLTSLLFLLVSVLAMSAAPVGRNAARQIAAQFAQSKGAQLVAEPRVAPGRMATAQRQPLYVFNMADDRGFVIVAGNDQVLPVLGYTVHGSYDETALPDNFSYWMASMASAIEALGETDGDKQPTEEETDKRAKIDPLIKTQWGQGRAQAGGYIYNMFCPEIEGKRALTGCVATVGAQLMYYYQHPTDSVGGVPGYVREDAVADTSEPLDSTIFKWGLMKPAYSRYDQNTESAKAVSELMLYCGYLANMNYGLTGSGSNEWTLAQNMVKYFDYDPYTLKHLNRTMFSVRTWDEMIYGELAEGRPVIYSGSGNVGGHAFLCDGYDGEGLYHFNWGWGGEYDGWFALSTTNPYGVRDITMTGFVFNHLAIIGLQPNTGTVPEVEDLLDEPEEQVVIDGVVATILPQYLSLQGTDMRIYYFNLTGEVQHFDFGLAELNADGSMELLKIMSASGSDINNGEGFGYRVSFPSLNLPVGRHTLVGVSRLLGEEEWKRCQTADVFFVVNVEAEGDMTIDIHPMQKLVVHNFEMTSPCLPHQKQTAKLTITNEGDFYDSYLQMILCSEGKEDKALFFNFDGSTRYYSGVPVRIKTGNTKTYDITMLDNDSVFAPGSYMLKIFDTASRTFIDSTRLVIGRDLKVVDFAVNGDKHVGSIQEIVVTVKNLAGDYSSPLFLFASRTEQKDSCTYAAGLAVESGDSVAMKFYFRPEFAGNWNIWVAYDEQGDDVICRSVVTIVRDPEEVQKAMDVDNDGSVTIRDVEALAKLIASASTPADRFRADIDGDGNADIGDIVLVIKAMMPEKPAETDSQMVYFIGATDGWNNEEPNRQRLSMQGDDYYTGFVYIADPNEWGLEFKLQKRMADWADDSQLNSNNIEMVSGDFEKTADNFKASAGEGVYYVVLDLKNSSLTGTRVQSMSLIGYFNGWSDDVPMTWNAADYCFEVTEAPVTNEGWKFRVNNEWSVNLGGDTLTDLGLDGNNLTAVGSTIRLYPTRRTSTKIFCTVE